MTNTTLPDLRPIIREMAWARIAQMPWVEPVVDVEVFRKQTMEATEVIFRHGNHASSFMLPHLALARMDHQFLLEYLQNRVAVVVHELYQPKNVFEAAEKMLSFSEMREV